MSADLSGAPRPVIVGSGLTGLAISHSLSRASIPHVLIGGPPDDRPRLGESLNLEGSLLLDEFCGEFDRFIGPKEAGVLYMGDHVLRCDFDIARKLAGRAYFRLLGTTAIPAFFHIDRLGLDAAMYERAAASPWCEVIDAAVESVAVDRSADRVEALDLSGGVRLTPSYVFDATNHRRTIAKALERGAETVGAPQRVAYTHYHPSPQDQDSGSRSPCDWTTNLLRLYCETDGVDAMAWYIPLPGYISVGVSVDEGTTDLSDEELLESVRTAYSSRGLDYRSRYPVPAPVMSLHHRYFVHDRAYGPNWMLAGGTYASVWWLAGAGVGTSFAAARMATKLLDDPAGAGRTYQDYLSDLLPIHGTFDWFVYSRLEEATPEALSRQSDRFVRTNVSRLAHAARIDPRPVPRAAGALLGWLVRTETIMGGYCRVLSETRAKQTEAMFGPMGVLASAPEDEATVTCLAEVISGRRPLSEADHLLDRRVVAHLDGFTARGRPAWRSWVEMLRRRAGPGGLDLIDLRTYSLPDGRVVMTGAWRSGGRVSEEVSATYRLVGGRIVEIWTSRANYEHVLGHRTRSSLRMLPTLARVGMAARVRRRSSLAG